MEKNCFICKYYDQPSFEMKKYCWECLRQEEVYARWERKPITNADRIRAMTDEELAKWRSSGQCPTDHYHGDYDCMNRSCEDCWLDWLRQEAET